MKRRKLIRRAAAEAALRPALAATAAWAHGNHHQMLAARPIG
jgi:hypothetical protein